MKSGAKAGGVASLIQALCYICGFTMLATVMNLENAEDWSQVQKLEYILEHAALFQLWNVIIYVIFGIALVVLAASLHRLLGGSELLGDNWYCSRRHRRRSRTRWGNLGAASCG